ncbi:Ntn hydrolase family protein [Halalkalicoccus jeotgali]|uniref:proteasome endopeptidase complex n=1 Tax=Halalkalicoccus jeotgali (strain DSM 18796 / CECT 7217 / JCM 14584 / KCTC 4019 / B3) TaxID=795797 RepID=D8J9S9_HALJB|nr:20S proteasome subunits A and B [Halalkalicoccus jeotgali]ADJ16418.1 20S proteasome A and B subunits [Halalkalicoccus jeotgali B3]ELY37152.1 20S proteasome subunits A and B [Halalkalicoccus jeotgali B3]
MGTVVGVRLADGVVLGADKRATSGSTVRSESVEKLFEFDGPEAGAVAAGETGAIQTFGRKLDTAVRQRGTEQGSTIRIDPLSRLASELANETGVEAVVAARDEEGVARLRAIDSAGGELDDDVHAQGSGRQFALGQLEGLDRDGSIDGAVEALESVFERIAERDTETGADCVVWTLADG